MNTLLSNSVEIAPVYPPLPLYAPMDGLASSMYPSSIIPPSYITSEASFELHPTITPVAARIAPIATTITKEKNNFGSNLPQPIIINNETTNNPSAINKRHPWSLTKASRYLITVLPLILKSSLLTFPWVKFGDRSMNWNVKLLSDCDVIEYMPNWLITCRNLICAAIVCQLLNVVFFLLSCFKRFKNRKIIIFSIPFLAFLFIIMELIAVIITSSNIEKCKKFYSELTTYRHPKPAYAAPITNIPYNGEYGSAWYLAVVSVALSSFILIFYFWVVTYFTKRNLKHGYEP